MKKDLKKELKNNIKNNQIKEAIDLLENEIKIDFTNKIKQINDKVQYIDIINLKENVEKYLSRKENVIFKKFFIILNSETNELYQLERLSEIYNTLREEVK